MKPEQPRRRGAGPRLPQPQDGCRRPSRPASSTATSSPSSASRARRPIGMPELHKLTPALGILQDRGFKVALVTDGRMSGASGKVPAAIHMTPEAIDGGAIAKIRDGDLIRLDADAGTLTFLGDEREFFSRTPATEDLRREHLRHGPRTLRRLPRSGGCRRSRRERLRLAPPCAPCSSSGMGRIRQARSGSRGVGCIVRLRLARRWLHHRQPPRRAGAGPRRAR
ncbi:MAG: dihydroxy-acid dehydratase [Candidatus Promineifilaceae bacterium]